VLAAPSTFSSWVDNHLGFVGQPPVAYAPGTSFGQRIRVMGMPTEVNWTVQGLEEPKRVVLTGNGPMGIGLTAAYLVSPVSAGSRVDVQFDFAGLAVFAIAGQLDGEVGGSLRTSLAKLKELVEGGAGA
jgi:acetyl-CoA C-acetyltransferase